MNSEYEFIVATPAIFIDRGDLKRSWGTFMKIRVLMWVAGVRLVAALETAVPRSAPILPRDRHFYTHWGCSFEF